MDVWFYRFFETKGVINEWSYKNGTNTNNYVVNPENAVDRNWTSYASVGCYDSPCGAPKEGYVYINYTGPKELEEREYKVKVDSNFVNKAIFFYNYSNENYENGKVCDGSDSITICEYNISGNYIKNGKSSIKIYLYHQTIFGGTDDYLNFYEGNMTNSGEEISQFNSISNGSTATYQWAGLQDGTTYKWFATPDDGTETTTSPVWGFTTTS